MRYETFRALIYFGQEGRMWGCSHHLGTMMPKFKLVILDEDCAPRRVLELFSVKWTTMVLHSLHFNGGTCRTGTLARSLPGCSKKMLTQTLREMERDRLIDRKVYLVVPPMVEYSLTPWAGSSLSRSRCFMRGRPRTTTCCRSSGGGGRSTRLRETKRGRFNNPQSRPKRRRNRVAISVGP
jgi:DNA-binding HxlR family transcriptional regulator